MSVTVARHTRTTGLLHQVTAGHDPDRVAIRSCGPTAVELTYGDLERRSNQLAHALRRAGVGTGDTVGLLLDRDAYLPVARLAVMKAGAAWMSLDPQVPAARLAFQVGDAAAPLVLTTADLAGSAPAGTPLWRLDELDRSGPDTPPDVDVRPDDPAYLIYTSGSTGTPKGVLVPHSSAALFCHNAVDLFGITPADRVAQVSNPAFDASIFDCFATLLAGATMVSAPRETVADLEAFTALLRDERVTITFVPPAVLALLDPDRLADSALRALFIAGEALGAEQVNRWSRPGLDLHNSYGPTETTVFVTDYLCPGTPLTAAPPIGTVLPEHRGYVLDARLRPVPVGIPGQLYIAGAGVSHGYHRRPALTAQRFLPDPHSDRPGRRMYATGDLVRWRSDGNLEYLGRIDRQVKIRGQRVELGEIEHAIAQHAGVRQCAVVLREDSVLTAYVVGDVDLGRLRGYLAGRLPTYMVPAALVPLPTLPLNPNGKLDTARLPAPTPPTVQYRAPGAGTEAWLADTWRDLLQLDQVGAGDTFFDLGANSLEATQLTARIRDHLGVHLHPQHLFANPTLEELARRLDEESTAAPVVPAPPDAPEEEQEPEPEEELDDEIAALERLLAQKRAAKVRRAQSQGPQAVSRDVPLPCTLQQDGLWFVQQLDSTSSVYHIGFGMRLRGDLDREALATVLHALVRRHEALRTRFVAVDGVPRQLVDPPPPAAPPLSIVDIAGTDVDAWVAELIARPLDLAAAPPLRTALGRVTPDEHVLVMVVHHIVADGWSVGILAGELSQLYAAMVLGIDVALPDLPMQPADHAAWQRSWLDGAELERQLGYWRETLAGLPTVDFPTDRPRPARPTGAGANLFRPLPNQLAEAARAHARTQQVSFLAVAQATLLTVLHRYTGQTDLPIGSIFSGRTRTETEPLVGFFANTLVLRTGVEGDPSFAELVRRCHHTVLDAAVHQDVPFGLVVDTLRPERTAGRNPLFQISLTLMPGRGGGGGGQLRLGRLVAEPISVNSGYARFDLTLDLAEDPDGGLALTVEYSTELFDADRIERLVDHFTAALSRGLAAPDTAIGDLDILAPAERERVLYAWNPPPLPRPTGLLHQVTSGKDPDRVAVRFGPDQLTYGKLERRSNRLAHALRDAGIGAGHIVALLLDRGLHLPVAQLAVMKAGAAWTPLDPQVPPARLAFQVADAAASLVLTTADLSGLAPAGVPRWDLAQIHAAGPDTPPTVDIGPDEPAYLLYTSGSTGTPKGVLLSHLSAYNYCQNAVEQFAMTPDDRVAQVANPAFDVSMFDSYATWMAGATLIAMPRATVTDAAALTALMHAEGVTLAYLPPALLALLDPARVAEGPLRGTFSAGEALPAEQVRRWTGYGPVLHNSYGPTETSVVCTDYPLPATALSGPPPIGVAMPNHRAYVLDGRFGPVPVGVSGELFIAGAGVAHGYLHRPGLTAQSFLPDPFARRPGERMYRTGDLARWRADGVLEFAGRRDRQVQLRGQRIELGEIEYALCRHPRVDQCVVVLRDTTLAAYLVGDADLDDVRQFLADRLPTYMLPTVYVPMAALPVTVNGKIDTDGLPDPVPVAAQYLEPRTDTERLLATIWQELLDVDRVGASDSFFDLGGNSLYATRLTARIQDHLDIQLHPQHLFTHPKLAHLAARLDELRAEPGTGLSQPAGIGLVTLEPAGTRPPLFLIHAAGGTVTPYAQFASVLGDDRPVHAIEDPGLRGAVLDDGLVERARRYVELVRQVQPDGPYHLGGWSLGGLIGLEMARLLTDAGATVAVVVAVDSGLPDRRLTPSDVDLLVSFVLDMAGRIGAPLPDFDARALQGLAGEALEERALDVLDKAGLAPGDFRDELRVWMRVFAANLRAFWTHEPRPYDGRVVLVRAADTTVPETFAGWPALARRLEQRTMPGNHYTIMQPPQVDALADVVRDVLCGPAPGSGDKTPSERGQ